MLNKIKEGSAVAITVMGTDNKVETWTLALVLDKRWSGSAEYAFLSPEKIRFVKGGYSGGSTGIGISYTNIFGKIGSDYELITEDLAVMNQMAEDEENKIKMECAEGVRLRAEKIFLINRLPTEFNVSDSFSGLVVLRSPITDNSLRNPSSTVSVVYNGNRIWIYEYITKNGKLQYKKFDGSKGRIGFDADVNVKVLLPLIVEKYKTVVSMINQIIYK